MANYSKKSQASVKQAVHKFKRGELKSGKSKAKVKSRKQAIAIGPSEARAKGEKVPVVRKKKKLMNKKKIAHRSFKTRKTEKKRAQVFN